MMTAHPTWMTSQLAARDLCRCGWPAGTFDAYGRLWCWKCWEVMTLTDQVIRRQRFELAHPGVVITYHETHWQAVIPERDGETVIVRYELEGLLDRLEELAGGGQP